MGLSGIFLHDSLTHGTVVAEGAVLHELEDEVLRTAIEALNFAKEQAPWEDRTGDARAGLDTHVQWVGDTIVWELFHTVSYGLYLETRWNGKYSVIMPTLELFAPEIGRGLSESGGNYGG